MGVRLELVKLLARYGAGGGGGCILRKGLPVRVDDRCGTFQAALDNGAVLDLDDLPIVGDDCDDPEVAVRLGRGRLAKAQFPARAGCPDRF